MAMPFPANIGRQSERASPAQVTRTKTSGAARCQLPVADYRVLVQEDGSGARRLGTGKRGAPIT